MQKEYKEFEIKLQQDIFDRAMLLFPATRRQFRACLEGIAVQNFCDRFDILGTHVSQLLTY
ncbi:hypothetical protein JXJ21_02395 [candidate division KSB1 bacterium]|nr:hypothetical protein [candidate division KSB1 bacterium]